MTSGHDLSEDQLRRLHETGKITWTPGQLEARFAADYPSHAFDYGLQYLGAGRFAAAAHFMPVGASLLHHAVEMFLKGTLAQGDDAGTIRNYRDVYGHRLGKLWDVLCKRYPDATDMHEFDDVIAALDKFEDIRFPEQLIGGGAIIETGFATPVCDIGTGTTRPQPRFSLGMPGIDRLVHRLFKLASFNPEFFASFRSAHAAPFFALHNDWPLPLHRS